MDDDEKLTKRQKLSKYSSLDKPICSKTIRAISNSYCGGDDQFQPVTFSSSRRKKNKVNQSLADFMDEGDIRDYKPPASTKKYEPKMPPDYNFSVEKHSERTGLGFQKPETEVYIPRESIFRISQSDIYNDSTEYSHSIEEPKFVKPKSRNTPQNRLLLGNLLSDSDISHIKSLKKFHKSHEKFIKIGELPYKDDPLKQERCFNYFKSKEGLEVGGIHHNAILRASELQAEAKEFETLYKTWFLSRSKKTGTKILERKIEAWNPNPLLCELFGLEVPVVSRALEEIF